MFGNDIFAEDDLLGSCSDVMHIAGRGKYPKDNDLHEKCVKFDAKQNVVTVSFPPYIMEGLCKRLVFVTLGLERYV